MRNYLISQKNVGRFADHAARFGKGACAFHDFNVRLVIILLVRDLFLS